MMREKTQQLIDEQQARRRRRLWWLMPTLFAWPSSFLCIGYIGTLIFEIVPPEARGVWWQVPILVFAVLALLLVDRVEYWRYGKETPGRMKLPLLTIRILLIIPVVVLEGFHFEGLHIASAFYILLPYFSMLYFGNKAGYGMAALVSGVYFVEQWWYQPDWYLSRASIVLAFLFFFGVMLVVFMARAISLEKAMHMQEQASRIRAEELLAEVNRSHRQLQSYAERVSTLATAEERNRVAREIHDGLGHALMAINVQLEKALVYHDAHPREALQAISDAKQVAKDALQDVRRSVRALRTEPEPFSCAQEIEQLIEQLRANSLAVDFVVSGDEKTFSRQALTTLYRVAQEGFTNIQKHAQASVVQVGLHFAEEEALLSIRDNGSGFDAEHKLQQPERPEEGYGLRGIQERLALIGGRFHLESQSGYGTHLSVTVARTHIPAHIFLSMPQRADSSA